MVATDDKNFKHSKKIVKRNIQRSNGILKSPFKQSKQRNKNKLHIINIEFTLAVLRIQCRHLYGVDLQYRKRSDNTSKVVNDKGC